MHITPQWQILVNVFTKKDSPMTQKPHFIIALTHGRFSVMKDIAENEESKGLYIPSCHRGR